MRLKDYIASLSADKIFLMAKQGGYTCTLSMDYASDTTKLILLAEIAALINEHAMEDEDEQ